MTAPAAAGGLRSGLREAVVAYWSARSIVYAAIVTVTVMSLPDGSPLEFPGLPGGTAVALAVAAGAALVAFACVEQRARLRGGRTVALAAVVLAALCSLHALRAGGEVLSAAFAGVFVLALDRSGPRRAILPAALTVAWCNCSAAGLVAPLIASTFALGATFEGADSRARRSAWFVVAACALATLATPAFLALPAHALEALRLDRALLGIVALHPVDVAPAAYRIGFTLAVLAFLAVGSGNRVRAGDASLAILATLLALANGAYLALFGVLVAPLLARSVYESFAFHEARDRTRRDGDFVLAGAAIVFAAVSSILAAPRADAALAAQPYALANAALARGTPHRFFCADPAWCGAILASGPRGTSVLVDGHVADYSAAALAAQNTIAHVSPGWRATLDRTHVDALLVRRDRALATLLAMRGDWRAVAQDATAELFTRSKPLR